MLFSACSLRASAGIHRLLRTYTLAFPEPMNAQNLHSQQNEEILGSEVLLIGPHKRLEGRLEGFMVEVKSVFGGVGGRVKLGGWRMI